MSKELFLSKWRRFAGPIYYVLRALDLMYLAAILYQGFILKIDPEAPSQVRRGLRAWGLRACFRLGCCNTLTITLPCPVAVYHVHFARPRIRAPRRRALGPRALVAQRDAVRHAHLGGYAPAGTHSHPSLANKKETLSASFLMDPRSSPCGDRLPPQADGAVGVDDQLQD